jgi:hypothetical protein
MNHLTVEATGVKGDLLDSLDGFEGDGGPLGVGYLPKVCFQIDCKHLGLNDGLCLFVALNVALVGVLVSGAEGADPVGPAS